MSIYTGLEATIKLLRTQIEANKAVYIEKLVQHIIRNGELSNQNDGLSDRIHLDLDPRIERLTTENVRLQCKLDRIHEEYANWIAYTRS